VYTFENKSKLKKLLEILILVTKVLVPRKLNEYGDNS
jgi:hypothetical protein